MKHRKRGRADLGVRAEINVTSLVDVAFTLLVIFIITAPVLQGGIEVNVPRGPVRVIEASDDHIIVGVDATGSFFIGSARVAEEMLDATLAQLVSERDADMIYLKGDSAALYGRVARAVEGIVDRDVRLALILREVGR